MVASHVFFEVDVGVKGLAAEVALNLLSTGSSMRSRGAPSKRWRWSIRGRGGEMSLELGRLVKFDCGRFNNMAEEYPK